MIGMTKEEILARGLSASSGRVVGKVRVVFSPSEVYKVQKGEVFVAVETNPEYILGMINAAAIVTDRGGFLSHSAIVARELGIPGVVGTGDATKKLKDGMEVVVDGTKGVIIKKDY